MGKNQNVTDILSIKDKLRGNQLFKNLSLSNADFDKLEFKLIDLESGEILFRQEDPTNSIYMIIEGEINLIKRQGVGKTQTLLSKNSFLGHEEYFLKTNRNSIAIALRDSQLAELSKENIETILSRKNSVLNNIKNSILAFNMVSINKFENIIDELTDRPEKKNSILPMELKTNNNKKPLSTPKDKPEITGSQTPDYNKIDSTEIESGIAKIISKLNEDLTLLEKGKNKIQSALSTYGDHNKRLLDEIEKLRKQESKYVNLDKEKNEILGWQSYRIIELEKELGKLKELKSEHTEKIDSLSRQDAKNRINIQRLESELQKKSMVVSELESTLEENKNQEQLIKTQEANLKNSAEKIEALTRGLSEKEINLNELNEDILDKNNIISEQNNILNKIKSETNELRLSLQKRDEEIGGLSSNLKRLQNQLNGQREKTKDEFILNQSHKIAEFEETLRNSKKESRRKEEIINKFIEDIGEFARGVWHNQNEINRQEEIINKFIEDIGEFARGVWHKQNEINRQADTINKLNNEIDVLKKSSEIFLNTETELKEKISDLHSQLTKAKNELDVISREVKYKAVEIENKEKENIELSTQAIKFQKELSGVRATLQNEDDQINNLENTIAQLKNDAIDQSEMQKLKDDLNSVSTQLSQKERENTELNVQVTKLQDELNEVKATLQNKDAQINNLENAIARDLDSVSVQLSQKDKDNFELNNEKNNFLERIKTLEQVVEDNKNKTDDNLLIEQQELDTLKSEVEKYKNNIIEKDKIIDQQKEDLENVESTKSEVIKILTLSKKSYQEDIKVKDELIDNLSSELELLKKIYNEEPESHKIDNQVSEPDAFPNESNAEDGTIDSEENDSIPSKNDEDVKSLESDILNEDDEILSKSKFIVSASSNSLDDKSFECVKYADIYIVNLNLSRATMDNAGSFSKFLSDLINSNKTKLIVNLSRCEFIDSSILGALVNSLKKITALGGDLRIVWLDQSEYSMLNLTRMDKIFQIFNRLKDAVESYL